MKTTLEDAGDKGSDRTRRPVHGRTEVLAVTTQMVALGFDLEFAAAELGMTGGTRGSLAKALRRAGRQDILNALRGVAPFRTDVSLGHAETILANLPHDDEMTVQRRRHDLVEDAAPAGHRVRTASGIWKWVA